MVTLNCALSRSLLDDSKAPLLFTGNTVDYGNYRDVVFHHNIDQKIEVSMMLKSTNLEHFFPSQSILNDAPKNSNHLKMSDTYRVCLVLSEKNGGARLDRISVQNSETNTDIFTVQRTPNDTKPELRMEFSESKQADLYINDEFFEEFTDKFFIHPTLLPIMREVLVEVDWPAAEDLELYHFFFDLFTAIHRYFQAFTEAIQYICPFRTAPERFYRFRGNAVSHVGGIGEFAPLILGQDRRNGGQLLDTVSKWLQDHLGFSLEIEDMHANSGGDSELFKLMIYDKVTKVRNNLMDVGHGLPQLIPIIVETLLEDRIDLLKGFNTKSAKLHIIEQPELHLHPAAQASLADLFVAGVQKNKRERKFLIETHSEHMLIRLRRFVAEGKISPDDIAIYYTEKQKSDGSITVQRLNIEPDGQMDSWPEGFFEEDYRESLALRKAMRDKRKQTEV